MKESFKGRLNLSEKASQALLFMVQDLKEKNPHIQLNPSKLCSWIIEKYSRDHFNIEATEIVQEHFNPKRYLTEMLKQTKTEEDIKALFENAVRKMDGSHPLAGLQKKRIGRRSVATGTGVNLSPISDEKNEKNNLTDNI